jgi:hypothetical protein
VRLCEKRQEQTSLFLSGAARREPQGSWLHDASSILYFKVVTCEPKQIESPLGISSHPFPFLTYDCASNLNIYDGVKYAHVDFLAGQDRRS